MGVLNTIGDLRLKTGGKASAGFLVLGHSMPGDGGGGCFYWDDFATEEDNNGTIISPIPKLSKRSGRWKRLYDGPLSVCWFGAKGDGSSDSSEAINNAIRASSKDYTMLNGLEALNEQCRNIIYIPQGTYAIKNPIKVLSGTNIVGNGRGNTIIKPECGITAFEFLVTETKVKNDTKLQKLFGYHCAIKDLAIQFETDHKNNVGISTIEYPGAIKFSGLCISCKSGRSGKGIWIGSGLSSSIFDCIIENFDVGIYLQETQADTGDPQPCNAWSIMACCIRGNDRGMQISGDTYLYGNAIQGNRVGVADFPIDLKNPTVTHNYTSLRSYGNHYESACTESKYGLRPPLQPANILLYQSVQHFSSGDTFCGDLSFDIDNQGHGIAVHGSDFRNGMRVHQGQIHLTDCCGNGLSNISFLSQNSSFGTVNNLFGRQTHPKWLYHTNMQLSESNFNTLYRNPQFILGCKAKSCRYKICNPSNVKDKNCRPDSCTTVNCKDKPCKPSPDCKPSLCTTEICEYGLCKPGLGCKHNLCMSETCKYDARKPPDISKYETIKPIPCMYDTCKGHICYYNTCRPYICKLKICKFHICTHDSCPSGKVDPKLQLSIPGRWIECK